MGAAQAAALGAVMLLAGWTLLRESTHQGPALIGIGAIVFGAMAVGRAVYDLLGALACG